MYEQWLSTTQTSTVAEYRRRFIETARPLERVTEDMLLGHFINGLQDDIKAEIHLLNPMCLEQAMEQALRVEEKFKVMGQRKVGWNTTRGGSFQLAGKGTTATSSVALTGATSTPAARPWSSTSSTVSGHSSSATVQSTGDVKRLTESELQDKRAKGLCYRCDAKWTIGHRCKKKELSVMLIAEEEEDPDGDNSEPPPSPTEVVSEVSLNSVVGISNPKTMKLKGIIGSQVVIVMVDPGATHNFISLGTVAATGVPVERSVDFGVSLGNGETIKGEGICREVRIHLDGGLEVVEDFLPLQLGSSDVILGVAWLEKLGMVLTDWKKQIMKFEVKGEPVTLTGDPSLIHAQVSLKVMKKMLRQNSSGFLVECNAMKVDSQLPGEEEKTVELIPPFVTPVLEQFGSIFEVPCELPPARGHEHAINLKAGSNPVSVRPYRYPQHQKDEIERLIAEMLAAGIIKPSTSAYSSPVLLVKKKDGSWRFCVDYRALNKETVPDKYPIPVIEELLDELYGATVFSKLDLRSGYHQILVTPEDTHKTAFRTHDGHYEFLVMPFGLMNAPSTFQSLMNNIFRPYLRRFVLVFFDDILVYSPSQEEHLQHLELVLRALEQHKLFVNKKKCEFGKQIIGYLGHIISAQGVEVDAAKVKNMLDWPQPKTLRDLRGFLGLTGYYRKFVAGYASIARPLTEQLKKDQFGWNTEAEAAFEQLKQAMASPPVLAMPNFNQPFVIEADASGFGIGAVLLQKERPIAYFSKLLGTRAQHKSVYEKELIAICLAILRWKPYLLGRHFIVRSDQQSLRFLTQQREVNHDYQKWVTKLLGFDFEIQYKAGCSNRVADALSRKQEGEVVLNSLISTPLVSWEILEDEISKDPVLQALRTDLITQQREHPGFGVVDNRIVYKGRIVIPQTSVFCEKLLYEFHDSATGGHAGELKTYLRLATEWYWMGMRKAVADYVRRCATCQQNKAIQLSPAGLLQPLPIPLQIWSEVSMDFVEGLPLSGGYNAVLVVVDRLSKYAHFLGLRHPFDAFKVAGLFVKEIVRLHGFPISIVSDRDKIFLSTFWREMFRLHGTDLKRSTSYHPQTDGQSEIVNKGLETYLHCFIGGKPKSWAKWLHWAEYSYNTSPHCSTKISPFKAVYGRDPHVLMHINRGDTAVDSLEELLLERNAMLDELRFQLVKAQQVMKSRADGKRRDEAFAVDDWVYLKLQPYRQKSLARRPFDKLAARYYGPFRITQKIGQVAYRLQLPDSATIHPVFHVSQLKRTVMNTPVSPSIPPQLTPELELVVEPEDVLEVRHVKVGNSSRQEALIKWKTLPDFEATWEDVVTLANVFPSFHLEDKVTFWGGEYCNAGQWGQESVNVFQEKEE